MKPRSFLTLAVLPVAACALGPDYKPLAAPAGAQASFVTHSAATTEAPLPNQWWKLYNDPALDQLVAQAFSNNENLQVAEDRLAASRAVLERARDGLYPQTELASAESYGRDPYTNEIREFVGLKPATGWTDDTILDASYEIDLFGHVRRSIEAARDSDEAVAAARDALRVTIAAETARAYGQICTLGEQQAVAQRSLDLANQQYDIMKQREAAGAASPFDVTRQATLVSVQRAALAPLDGARRAALFELADLLGEVPSQAPQDVLNCKTAPQLTALVPVGDGAVLLKRRPDIREADRAYAAQLAEVGVATADLFPRITLSGFYGGAAGSANTLFSGSGLAWGIGPAVTWSFPNLSAPLAKLDQAKAETRAARDSYTAVILGALRETETALAAYRSELDHHAALLQARDEAKQAYGQAKDQQEAGSISTLDVLTSEQTVISTDAAAAASDAALVQDQISVFKALGGGWQNHTN